MPPRNKPPAVLEQAHRQVILAEYALAGGDPALLEAAQAAVDRWADAIRDAIVLYDLLPPEGRRYIAWATFEHKYRQGIF